METLKQYSDIDIHNEAIRRCKEDALEIDISELTKRELAELYDEIRTDISYGDIQGRNTGRLDGVLFAASRRIMKKRWDKEFKKMIKESKTIKTVITLLASTLLLVGCAERKVVVENRAVVSIAPLKPLVESILGDDFEVSVLVPFGASPETFEPTAKQLQEVESARFVFGTGLLEFEQELLHRIARKEQIVNTSEGIELIAGTCSHAHHKHHKHHKEHAHGVDPHIWCSPKSLIKMTENIYSRVIGEMPDSTKYKMAYNYLMIKLHDLNMDVAKKCWECPRKTFMIYHPALTYLARDYGMKQVAIENEGKEPSAKRLAKIIELARTEGIKHIFYQSEFPASSVAVICEDANATAVEINPLDENIFENIRPIATLITE